MITEQDLRAALTRRADSAPDFHPDRVLAAVGSNRNSATFSPRWHRHLAVAGAAATVAAVTAGAVLLAQRPAAPAAAGRGAAAVSSAHLVPPNPPVPSNTPAPSTTPPGPQPPAIVRVTSDNRDSSVDRRRNVEYFTTRVGIKHTTVAAFRTGVFHASRVAHAVPARIDGHPGLYGEVSVWPVNGRPDPSSGKQDTAVPSLAWRLGHGPWVVLQIDTPIHPTKAQLLAAAEHVTVTAAR